MNSMNINRNTEKVDDNLKLYVYKIVIKYIFKFVLCYILFKLLGNQFCSCSLNSNSSV